MSCMSLRHSLQFLLVHSESYRPFVLCAVPSGWKSATQKLEVLTLLVLLMTLMI